jgi:hypothetical protein
VRGVLDPICLYKVVRDHASTFQKNRVSKGEKPLRWGWFSALPIPRITQPNTYPYYSTSNRKERAPPILFLSHGRSEALTTIDSKVPHLIGEEWSGPYLRTIGRRS